MKKKTKIGLAILILLSIFVVTQTISYINDDFTPIVAFGPEDDGEDDPGDSPGPSDNRRLTGEEGSTSQSNREMTSIGKVKDHLDLT